MFYVLVLVLAGFVNSRVLNVVWLLHILFQSALVVFYPLFALCSFRDCACAECGLVKARQKIMAAQISSRRRQEEEERRRRDGVCQNGQCYYHISQ